MARPVQRGRKKPSKIDKSNNSSGESNQMVNTQIVKVVCAPPKKTRKRKESSSPKRESKKAEAISRLKQALEMFNEIKDKAMEAKVQIPASLGETPLEVNSVKTVSDIESLTQTILSRVREIEGLIQKSQSRPSFFGMPEQTGSFAREFAVNRVVLPTVTPSSTGVPVTPPQSTTTDPNIEKKLKDLERGLVPGNPEDVKEVQTIEQERLRKQAEIETIYNTTRQALAAQLAQGKLDQAGFDRGMKEATKAYNESLRLNEATSRDRISEFEKSKVGEGTEQKWKDILKTSNTLKIRLNSIQKRGSVTEIETQELEELQDYGRGQLDAFIATHRNDVERHPDLFPSYNAVEQQFKGSVRDQIKIPITDNRTRQDKIDHALRELEEINEMYLQLKSDISSGLLSSTSSINKKLADIERQHNRVKALNKSRGIMANDPSLQDMEDTLRERFVTIRSMILPSPSGPVSPSRIPAPPGGEADKAKQKLRKFVNGDKGFRNWTPKLTNAMRILGWSGYYYGTRQMADTIPITDGKVTRDDKVLLVSALLDGRDPPAPPWWKEHD